VDDTLVAWRAHSWLSKLFRVLARFACLFTETDQLRTQPSYRCLVLRNMFLQIYGQTYQCEKVYYISVRQNTGCDKSDKPNCLKRWL